MKPVIVPSAIVREQLLETARRAFTANPDRLRWYRMSCAAPWASTIPDDDWNQIHRTVLFDGVPLGWCSAQIDRECDVVTNVGAVSFAPSVAYVHALESFMQGLRREFALLRWSCVVGNPALPRWRRWAERNGGGDLVAMRRYARVAGRVVDGVIFEVPGCD